MMYIVILFYLGFVHLVDVGACGLRLRMAILNPSLAHRAKSFKNITKTMANCHQKLLEQSIFITTCERNKNIERYKQSNILHELRFLT